ncbi:hypothetical protein D9758_003668 [Tetrapyrgos nigripes]|uniref:Thiamine pyrophosphokinase n=1 Tax=Tetrapyrgos nigripes TaxID=182062 RepID=A0A8H5GML4_9AGAR|nr:hypothetical protein D9758_003668 [Tetrapyrgos nigripes]
MSQSTCWDIDFLKSFSQRVLIILNQPFSFQLLELLWNNSRWRYCADGGANRLYDLLRDKNKIDSDSEELLNLYKPDLIKGDLDSIRDDVKDFYSSKGVSVLKDEDQDSTDLMKCVNEVKQMEKKEGREYEIVILGGLTGRLDQTIHTLSYLHKLRKERSRVFAATDDNIGWVLETGEHIIHIDHSLLGQTCGLLPIGIDETVLTTRGLKWNLTNHPSSFDGLVSTSNHLIPEEDSVYIKTTKPIWWTVELRDLKEREYQTAK